MGQSIRDAEPYLKEDELLELHERTKNEAVAKVSINVFINLIFSFVEDKYCNDCA